FTPTATGVKTGTLQLSSDNIPGDATYGEFALSGNAFDLSDGVVEVPGEVPTIQEAIDASSDGDTVLVAAGTYYENIEIDKEIVVIGADRETTIIDGDSSGSVVYFGSNAGMDTYFSGFTVQNGVGQAINSGTHNNHNCGGGIVIGYSASPLLTDLIVQNNTVDGAGGGIFVEGNNAQLRLSNSIIRNNTAGHAEPGGGIQIDGGSGSFIHNVEVHDNFAAGKGGGISSSSVLNITNSVIHNNRCGWQGNGISAQMNMYNCVVTQNGWQSDDGGYNGENSVNLEGGRSRIWNSIVWGNHGEPIDNYGGGTIVDYSIIEGGFATGFTRPEYIDWGTHNSTLDPQFNDPDNLDFTPDPQTAGHVLWNGDPNSFFNNADGTLNHMGHTGGIGLIVAPTELEYGNISVGYDVAKSVNIINNTDGTLTLNSINSSSGEFDIVNWQPLPISIGSFESRGIDLQLNPSSTGEISVTAQLNLDPINNDGLISATAVAYDLPAGDILVPTDFATIQLALDIIPSGVQKTIVVEPGEYFENIML
ncbi:MAG TPA: right-handed parallel beta-helix repeat-containing protein, partial [Candidatus Marinimicrobia bacterium]|nr:right-handed parallel beta-helix repeat-containing protein [Candidatus Neomarinimicrobiota bacterium]